MRWVCLLALCSGAAAQEMGDLSTERPGFTATSGAVGLGVLQLEQGYTFESAGDEGSKLRTFSGPQALLRFGITDALELRFSTDGYAWERQEFEGSGKSISGPNDYILGAKLRILKQGVARPEVSMTGGVSLPALGSAFTSSGHDPSFTLAAYKDLPAKFSVAANANVASVTDAQGRYFGSGESLWAARNIGRGVSLFAETFHTSIDRLEGSEVLVDGGLFRGIGRHTQIDLSIGHTVTGERPSWYASVGCVFRIPRGLLR
jgi:Putative MetA-pathway of phenol degradation